MNAIAILYLQQPNVLRDHLAQWAAPAFDGLELIVVDDCSIQQPAAEVVRAAGMLGRVRVLRLDIGRPWDFTAGRNLCVQAARSDAVLLCDCDMFVEPETAPALAAAQLARGTFGVPARIAERALCRSLVLIRRDDFLQPPLGGYDARFVGYECDQPFIARRDALLRAVPLPDVTVRLIPNAGTNVWRRYDRNNMRLRDPALFAALARPDALPPGPPVPIPWHEVTA